MKNMYEYTNAEMVPALWFLTIIALIPAFIAWRKGHSFVAWYLWGLLLWAAAVPMAMLQKDITNRPGPEPTSVESNGA
jgi:hypothetical protein